MNSILVEMCNVLWGEWSKHLTWSEYICTQSLDRWLDARTQRFHSSLRRYISYKKEYYIVQQNNNYMHKEDLYSE